MDDAITTTAFSVLYTKQLFINFDLSCYHAGFDRNTPFSTFVSPHKD